MRIIEKIKLKKELSDIPDSLVEETLISILKKNNLSSVPEREKQQKQIIKETRAELRKYTGRFQINSRKREKLLQQGSLNKILESHTSTRERLKIYPELIKTIKELNPKSILDLGAGLNPLAIADKFDAYYHALDIKALEIELINNYFRKNKIKGKAEVKNIREMDNFPNADLTLIFKTLDIIETKGHRYAYRIMQNLKNKSKCIIVSFSTKTLSGKSMKQARRVWFENILKYLNYTYNIKLFDNEIFYLIIVEDTEN